MPNPGAPAAAAWVTGVQAATGILVSQEKPPSAHSPSHCTGTFGDPRASRWQRRVRTRLGGDESQRRDSDCLQVPLTLEA